MMKRRFPMLGGSLVVLCLLGAIFNSCSKANETTLKMEHGISGGDCDTVGMTYQMDILPIITANCYGCHSSETYQSSGSQLNYEDFNVLKTEVNNGELLNAIQHTGNVTPMPLNLPSLSECDINKIKDWVNNGSQNN